MQNFIGPIVDIVKFVGGPIVRYLKYQIKFNDHLEEYKVSKEDLCHREHIIRSRLDTALQCPWNVANQEVQKWLENVEEFSARQDVADEVNDRGCLSCCCRVEILEERTQQLKEIYIRGDKYIDECLVVEDESRKVDVYGKNFKDLKEKLQCKQHDINSMLQSQLGYGKMAKEEVKNWLKNVEEIIRVAKDIEDQINKGQSLSHAFAHLANLLNEKIQEMERTYEEGGRLTESLVIDDPSASVVELQTSELQGSGDVKVKILTCLMGDEVTKLGVWGMGGIGKTTIMMHIHNELLKEAKFKKVIWATVSQNFDIHNLQEQIASNLNEQLQKDQNTTIRAAKLSKMLERHEPYVLILDDVWNSFELKVVGIPEPLVTNGCKLVLTTRSQEVARSMGCKRIKVKTLSQGEALNLFLDKVGGIVLPDLKSTLKEIVNECDGLPLAILTVASSLKEIFEPRLWKAALNQLRECKRNVAGTDDDDAFRILKFSYDHLRNPKIQHCFLYCAMYPEDYSIPKKEIIEYWIDEGFIDEMETWQAMKDEGYDILRRLEDNCLLEFIKDKYGKDCVRMHDLVRDMALNITRTSPRFLVKAGLRLKKLPEKGEWKEDLERVSLMRNDIEEIPLNIPSSKCKMLTTLLLSYNNLSTIPESVFEYMPQLKILDLSYNEKLSSLPDSLSKLVNLTTLLLCKTSLTEVPSLSNLQALKKLDLSQSKLKEIPKGLEMLTNLKYLHISENKISKFSPRTNEIANEILSNLSKLQYLEVDREIALKGEVIGGLVKLEGFGGRLSTWHELSIFLKCLQDRGDGDGEGLSMYAVDVASPFSLKYGDYLSPLKLQEGHKKRLEFTDIDIDRENNLLLPSVQELVIDRCNNLRSLNDISAIKYAKELKCCSIRNCKGVECVLSSSINPLVQKIELLELYNLEDLDALFEVEAITKSPMPPNTFSSLKRISVYGCKKIKKLFPLWLYLQSLEEIDIRECEQMEEIIAWDVEEAGGEKEGVVQLILPKLKSLTLLSLPALESICSKKAVMVCDSLKVILMVECMGLRRIPLYLPLLDNEPSPPPSLTQIVIWPPNWWQSLEWDHLRAKDVLLPFCTFYGSKMMEFTGLNIDGENTFLPPSVQELVIQDCNNLRRLNDISAIKDAKELEVCRIWNCKGMECVLSFSINPLVQMLVVLELCNLKNLDALFEARLPPDSFSSLKKIRVWHCNKIKKLFSFLMYLQSLKKIDIGCCQQMEEIIAWDPEEAGGEKEGVIQLIFPQLKCLKLEGLPSLKSICSRRAAMVCDSLQEICIQNCEGLRRIPLYLHLLDNGQPSPPPSLKQIRVWPKEWGQSWWESLEWSHPNAKDVLLPFRKFTNFLLADCL